MVEDIVVTNNLSIEMISAGKALVQNLDKAKFIVSSALWFYFTEAGVWRFVVASPEVRIFGPKKAYKQIFAVIRKMPPDDRIALKDISVVDSKDPLISLLKIAVATAPNSLVGARLIRFAINSTMIDDAYIYRLS